MTTLPVLWTALVTPFDATGAQVDYPHLEAMMREQAAVGNGIVLVASTGEGGLVSEAERKQYIAFAFGLNLGIPIMVSVPEFNLTGALAWLDYCKQFPVAGFLMAPPAYTKPGIKGQTAWFKALMDAAHAPVMLYNNPSRSAVRLHTETVGALKGHPRFWALKECGGVESLMDYQSAAPHVQLYSGDDNMLPALTAHGAVGLVSTAANVWPAEVLRYTQLSLAGRCPEPLVWWNSTKVFGLASNPIPIKALMHKVGKIGSAAVRLPLHQDDLPSVEPLVKAHEAIGQWMARHGG